MARSAKTQESKLINSPSTFFFQTKERFPFLHYIVLIHFVFLAFALMGLFIDSRELVGINIWIKPIKFILSAIVVLWTMAWYFRNYPFKPITASRLAIAAASLMLIENIAISTQAWRGVQSHFNKTTPFDSAVFGIMGWAIFLFTIIAFWLFLKSFSPKLAFPTNRKWAFRIAWFGFLYASAIGGMMVSQGGHNVGVADGGNGIPFLNWSTEGGDLRVAHFFGLHAIQIIPLVTYFMTKQIRGKAFVTFLSIAFALLYLGLIILTCYQAKAGQAIL